MCDYGTALELFENDRWAPCDQTRSYWYRNEWGEFHYSENGEQHRSPDEWNGGGYSSDRVRSYVERGDWVIVDLDDHSGGQFQAIFTQSMRVKEYEQS